MDYLGAQSNSLAFCLSVERLLGVDDQMPARVKDIRILIAELQRISSHLVSLGTHALEVGAVSVLFYCLTDRERLLNINEMIAGFRMFPSYIRVGGLREDLPPGFHEAVTAFLDYFPAKVDEYEGLLTKNQIWMKRTQGVGALSREDHIQYGLVGPMARAIGIPYDVRKTFPVLGYETYDFNVPTADARRRLRSLPGARRRDAREREDRAAGAGADFSARRSTTSRTTGSCRRRRTRSTPRWKR